MTFWHYTCDHGRTHLGDEGLLKPLRMWAPRVARKLDETPHAWMAGVSWITDLDEPLAFALGLTRTDLRCDRTRFRYRVLDPRGAYHWPGWARDHVPLVDRRALNFSPGALPMHWWVTPEATPVVYDPV